RARSDAARGLDLRQGARATSRGGAPEAAHGRVQGGEAPRAPRPHRLQPERVGPDAGVDLLGAPDADGERLDAARVARARGRRAAGSLPPRQRARALREGRRPLGRRRAHRPRRAHGAAARASRGDSTDSKTRQSWSRFARASARPTSMSWRANSPSKRREDRMSDSRPSPSRRKSAAMTPLARDSNAGERTKSAAISAMLAEVRMRTAWIGRSARSPGPGRSSRLIRSTKSGP